MERPKSLLRMADPVLDNLKEMTYQEYLEATGETASAAFQNTAKWFRAKLHANGLHFKPIE